MASLRLVYRNKFTISNLIPKSREINSQRPSISSFIPSRWVETKIRNLELKTEIRFVSLAEVNF